MKASSRSKARTRLVRLLGSILGLGLFLGALWVLRHELQSVTFQDVLRELRSIPPVRLGGAFLLTGLGYLALAGYDLLALRYLGLSLPRRKVLFASFVGYALANNIPLAFLVGGSVRYRLYSGSGVSGTDTASLVLFNVLTYSLGLLTAAAVAFTLFPGAVPGRRSTGHRLPDLERARRAAGDRKMGVHSTAAFHLAPADRSFPR